MRSGVWSATSSVTSKRVAKRIEDLADENLRSGSAGGDADRRRLAEPVPVDISGPFDQPRRNTHPLGDLGQPERIAAVGRADDQHPVALHGDRFDRRLAIRRRVADVLAPWRADRGEADLQRVDDRRCVVDRKVVCVRKARFPLSGKSRSRRPSTVSIRVIEPGGTWPNVPITSGWPA